MRPHDHRSPACRPGVLGAWRNPCARLLWVL